MKFARRINLRRVNNLIDWSIISSTSNKMKSMTKKSNWKNLKFCLHQKFATLLIFNWLKLKLECRIQIDRKDFCFKTNWIQLNQRLKSDKSTRRTQKKYFYFYKIQNLFSSSLCSFVKIWFFCCIKTFRSSNVYFLRTLKWRFKLYKEKCYWQARKTSSRKILESRIWRDILMFNVSQRAESSRKENSNCIIKKIFFMLRKTYFLMFSLR